MEEWKDIAGYEGTYQVSTLGNVRSIPRKVLRCGPRGLVVNRRGFQLRPFINHNGYKIVGLHKKGVTKKFAVARVVAKAFIPNEDTDLWVDHIDHDTLNNKLSNLRWVTPTQNRHNIDPLKVRPPTCRHCKLHCV